MISRQVHRNIPTERENKNDRFRVKFNDRKTFDQLEVTITRSANGEQQVFKFSTNTLPDKDSIYFTTCILNNKLQVTWQNIQPDGSLKLKPELLMQLGIDEPKKIDTAKGKTAFPPISNDKSKVLILGTMPGERSLFLQQYYGHAGNHLWKIMYSLFNKPFNTNYEDRRQLLHENGVALWDVLEYCEGKGSADTAITNEKANDFNKFYAQHPEIKTVFFSSKKAEEFYNSYVGKRNDINYALLPSPSSANTWKTYEEKLVEWKAILKHL